MGEKSGAGAALLFIVRHAEAGTRSERPDDHLRRLSASGWRQAQALADLLDEAPVGELLSSPYIRCVETVEPLAARQGRHVILTAALAEGAPIDPVLRLLEDAPDRSVVCTHGDILRGLADAIPDSATRQRGFRCFDKGVVWVVERVDGDFSVVDVIHPSVTHGRVTSRP